MKKVNTFIHHKYFERFITVLIVINVIALMLETFDSIREPYGEYLAYFELFSVVVFTIEYFLRWYIAKPRAGFVVSPMGIVDLLAVLPYYLPMLFAIDLRVLRILRLFRLIRIFKLVRYSKSMNLIQTVFRETRAELAMTLFGTFVLIILCSTLMFFAEHEAQPEQFSNMGQSLWWAVATLTTVGYGDIYPVTTMGKFLASAIAIVGIGFVALPTGILSSAFVRHIKNEDVVCPHCGERIVDHE